MASATRGGHPPFDASDHTVTDRWADLVDPMDAATRTETFARRSEVVRRLVREVGGASAFLTTRANVAWLTGGGQHHVVTATETGVAGILVTPAGVSLVTPNIERARLLEEAFAGLDLEVVPVGWWDPDALAGTARKLTGSAPLDDAALEAAGLARHRSILDPIDRERLTILGRAARRAVDTSLAALEPGMTEDKLAAALLGRLVGIRAPVVLVAADGRIARYRHALPGPSPIERRVMLVLVAEAWGLHVALTRFRSFEADPSDLVARWGAVREVQRAMTAATVPGATLGEVFGAAVAAYDTTGYPGEWRDHHQGGTIAYHARERVATPDDPTVIEPGMAFAWNPSIAGVKAEDTFVLEANGERRVVTDG